MALPLGMCSHHGKLSEEPSFRETEPYDACWLSVITRPSSGQQVPCSLLAPLIARGPLTNDAQCAEKRREMLLAGTRAGQTLQCEFDVPCILR